VVATKGTGWHLAASLVALINECDARWPARSKDSDGSIGDASHAARASEHNPDYSAGGVVRAVDVTAAGIDVAELLDALIGDPRVWYVIWNRRIASVTHEWKWTGYRGINPHTHHIHVSIRKTRPAETSTAHWFKSSAATEVPEVITDADADKIAAAVLKLVEPRIQAYARYVTLHEEQTDSADAQRAADATVAALDKRDKS
jgi:hypothetical protein